MQTVRNVLLTFIYVVVLGACGLKGPLYLPPEEPVSEPATGLEAESATEEDKDKKTSGNKDKKDDQNGR